MEINRPRSEVEHVINEWVFNERDRAVMKRRFLDGLTYEKLAEEFELSTQRVKSIVYKWKDTMFSHL